jgi:hypothetical protein
MPVQYPAGVLEEHSPARSVADVSHMDDLLRAKSRPDDAALR